MPRRQTRKPKPRVKRVEYLRLLPNVLDQHDHLPGQVLLRGFLVREELVQWRVEEADGGREACQGLEDADEVALLARQELGEAFFRSPTLSARIISRMASMRLPSKNMC